MDFTAIDEPAPGAKWLDHFKARWPAHRSWYLKDGLDARPDGETCRAAVRDHMPELLPLHDRLCELVGPDDVARRYLSCYRPPPLFSGCSVLIAAGDEPVLIRNYDFDPSFFEGTVFRGRWSGRHQVIAASEALWGALDGINDAGLAVALTFGGRPVHGDGFGIPVVLRYVLEVCGTCAEALEALTRIPCSYSQNVMLLDRGGDHAVAYLGPDRPAVVRRDPVTTNHQLEIEWPEAARWSQTVERADRLRELRVEPGMDLAQTIAEFHRPPLYRTDFAQGLGTLYTAVYRPLEGSVDFHWPYADTWTQSFDHFTEGSQALQTETPAGQSA